MWAWDPNLKASRCVKLSNCCLSADLNTCRCKHACKHACMHACMPVHRCKHAQTLTRDLYRSAHVYTQWCMHLCMSSRIHAHTQTCNIQPCSWFHLVSPIFPFLLVIYFSCFCLMESFCILRFYSHSLVFVGQGITKCQADYVAQAGLKLVKFLLPLTAACWDCRCVGQAGLVIFWKPF